MFDVIRRILDSLLARRFAALRLEVVLFLRISGCDWPSLSLTRDSLNRIASLECVLRRTEDFFRQISRRILAGARHT